MVCIRGLKVLLQKSSLPLSLFRSPALVSNTIRCDASALRRHTSTCQSNHVRGCVLCGDTQRKRWVFWFALVCLAVFSFLNEQLGRDDTWSSCQRMHLFSLSCIHPLSSIYCLHSNETHKERFKKKMQRKHVFRQMRCVFSRPKRYEEIHCYVILGLFPLMH